MWISLIVFVQVGAENGLIAFGGRITFVLEVRAGLLFREAEIYMVNLLNPVINYCCCRGWRPNYLELSVGVFFYGRKKVEVRNPSIIS